MNDHAALEFLRWFYTAFFAGFGVYFLVKPDFMLKNSCIAVRSANREDEARFDAAVARRRGVERISSATGFACGAFSMLLAVLSALETLPPALLYAFFCLGVAIAMSAVYLQLRNSQRTRVAVLSARRPTAVLPAWTLALAAIGPLAILPLASVPGLGLPATIVALSTLATMATAWRLTALPAVLQGVDLGAETVLDERVRFQRSGAVMVLAVVQPYVFASNSLARNASSLQLVYWITFAVWIVYSLWFLRKLRTKVSPATL